MMNNTFNILHWNSNGIRNRKVEFYQFLLDNKIHVACLNETKLNSHIRIGHSEFHVFRLDGEGGLISRGGVALIIHRSVQFEILPHLETELVEALGVKITGGIDLTIIAAYLTGTTAYHNYSAYRRDIRRLTSIRNAVILADLNSKHHFWGCQRRNQAGTVLYQEYCAGNFEICFPDQKRTTRLPIIRATQGYQQLLILC